MLKLIIAFIANVIDKKTSFIETYFYVNEEMSLRDTLFML